MTQEVKQGFTATPEQIAEWKKKHTDIFLVEIEGLNAYLHSPDRKTMGYAAAAAASDPMKFNEIILNGCWLGGDEEIKTSDRLFMGVCAKLDQIIETAEAEIKKL